MKLLEKNGLYLAKNDDFSDIRIKVLSEIKGTKKDFIISDILSRYKLRTNSVYKTKKEICDKFDELYSFMIYEGTSIIQAKSFHYFLVSMIDEKVLDVNYFDDAIKFMKDIFFNIRIENNKLDEKTINEIKKEMIDNQKNSLANPKTKAHRYYMKNIFLEKEMSNFIFTDIEEFENVVNSITNEDILDYYNTVNNSIYRGYVFGNVSEEQFDKINEVFNGKRNPKKIDYNKEVTINPKDIEYHDEETSQSTLICTYKIDDNKNNYIVYDVFDTMIDSMEGLLMELLRTKYGIVYSAYSEIGFELKYFSVNCEIDKKNKDKCLKAIDEMFEMLKDKEVVEKYLTIAKKKFNESFETYTEEKMSVVAEVDKKVFEKRMPKEEAIKLINKVSAEDIINILPNFKKVNTYFYRGDKNE